MRGHAFTAWQTLVSNWGDLRRRPPPFIEYLKRHGLAPSQDATTHQAPAVSDAERATAAAVDALIAAPTHRPLHRVTV